MGRCPPFQCCHVRVQRWITAILMSQRCSLRSSSACCASSCTYLQHARCTDAPAYDTQQSAASMHSTPPAALPLLRCDLERMPHTRVLDP